MGRSWSVSRSMRVPSRVKRPKSHHPFRDARGSSPNASPHLHVRVGEPPANDEQCRDQIGGARRNPHHHTGQRLVAERSETKRRGSLRVPGIPRRSRHRHQRAEDARVNRRARCSSSRSSPSERSTFRQLTPTVLNAVDAAVSIVSIHPLLSTFAPIARGDDATRRTTGFS